MHIGVIKSFMEWSDSMEAIRIEGLKKQYKDVVAVDDLNLTIHKGELFSIFCAREELGFVMV